MGEQGIRDSAFQRMLQLRGRSLSLPKGWRPGRIPAHPQHCYRFGCPGASKWVSRRRQGRSGTSQRADHASRNEDEWEAAQPRPRPARQLAAGDGVP
eukprot:gene9578-biopygen11497